jgi:hypothetical protein
VAGERDPSLAVSLSDQKQQSAHPRINCWKRTNRTGERRRDHRFHEDAFLAAQRILEQRERDEQPRALYVPLAAAAAPDAWVDMDKDALEEWSGTTGSLLRNAFEDALYGLLAQDDLGRGLFRELTEPLLSIAEGVVP